MSAPSVRRIKDRGGGGATAKTTSLRSSRSVTPVSSTGKIPAAGAPAKFSAEKENRRSTSHGRETDPTQKPAMRPVPRVDKASLVGGEARDRRSTSSVPRGRSSSPSEFNRVFSDIRRSRRVSVDRVVKGPIQVSDSTLSDSGCRCVRGTTQGQGKGYRDLNIKGSGKLSTGSKFSGDAKEGSTKNGINTEVKIGSSELLGTEKVKACNIRLNLVKSSAVHVTGNLQICGENGNSERELKIQSDVCTAGNKLDCCSVDVRNVGSGKDSVSKDYCKVLDAMEKGPDDECGSSEVGNKCPSRLHEKLAFLEGKVKRIASDIRKTKEMLDMNNPDASRVILSDIQDKISGIEKAMCHVTSDSGTKMGLSKNDATNNKESDMFDHKQTKKAIEGKSSVKGLTSEELEARLFPHHKLLRNRTLIKESTGSCVSNESSAGLEPQVKDKLLSPVDENSIAMEFLASLNKEKNNVSSSDKRADIKCSEVEETDSGASGRVKDSSSNFNQNCDIDLLLAADEKLDEFDDQENRPGAFIDEDTDNAFNYSLNEIGNKTTAGGWFVSEGEAVILAHDDGSCSYYDIANCEEKAAYMPPSEVSLNIWRDCWVIRAPGSDGCSGRFVVAASAGNTMDSGFCSWDFYTKEVRAFQVETGTTSSRTALRPLPNNIVQRRNSEYSIMAPETRQWWYKPCGPLIISTASTQRAVKVFDVRDGERIMKWDVQKPVLAMEYCSPMQWRNKGKVVIAEADSISLWDVNSLSPQALISIPSGGLKISALHVSNTDAELGGGVRKRVSSSEAEGNDGVFCTSDSINVLDFRQPSGVGLRISKLGVNVQSIFSRGDSVYLGCSSSNSAGKKQSSSLLQQFSLRGQGLLSTYAFPESNAHSHHAAITQLWGNSEFVMGVCGLGLYVFDALKDDALRVLNMDYSNAQSLREVIGPDDLYCPSFDYLGSRALLISRDRPAMWRHLMV